MKVSGRFSQDPPSDGAPGYTLVEVMVAAGILVLSDMAFPGWQAQVDGALAPILTVDHALRGLYLPAGTHNIEFSYVPDSLKEGAMISGVALLIMVGLVAVRYVLPRRIGLR